MQLIATKSLKYPRGMRRNTRALVAGDRFDAPDKDARLLVYATKKARFATPADSAQRAVVADESAQIAGLRVAAERLGIAVDKRWGGKRLQSEIDAKRASPGLMV